MEEKKMGCLKIFKVHDKRDWSGSDVAYNEEILVAENRQSVIDIIFKKRRSDPDMYKDEEHSFEKEMAVFTTTDVDRHFQIEEVGNICDLKSGDEISSCNYEFDY